MSFLICFDLCDTIITSSTYSILRNRFLSHSLFSFSKSESFDISTTDVTFIEQEKLRNILIKIHNKKGIICIISYTDVPQIIKPILVHLDLSNKFLEKIHIKHVTYEVKKSKAIRYIMKKILINNNRRVILYDDNETNILEAQESGFIGILADINAYNASIQHLERVIDTL